MADEQKVRELLDRGLTHYGLGQVEQAVEVWQQALELDPQNSRAREYIEFVRTSWGPQPPRPSAEPQPRERPNPGTATAPGAREEPLVVDSVFSQPPTAQTEPEPPPAVVEPPPPPSPPNEAPQGATGLGELFSGGALPADYEASEKTPSPRGAAPGPSTLPPHPVEPRPADPAPTPPAASPPQVIAVPAPGFTEAATIPYQAVPTKIRAVAPLEAAAPPEPARSMGPIAPAMDALDLVAGGQAPPPENEAADDMETWLKGASDLLALDDFSGAIELLDKILATWPDNRQAAQMLEHASRELGAMYRSKIGNFAQVPRVRMAADEIIWLSLDHRAGFLLSLIDGRTSYDEIMSVCGLPELDVLRLFAQLLQEGVIEPS